MLTVQLTLLEEGRRWAYITGDLNDGKISYEEITPGIGVTKVQEFEVKPMKVRVTPITVANKLHHELDGMPYRKFKDFMRDLGIDLQGI